MKKNIIAADLGYGFVKAVSTLDDEKIIFPSVIGSGYQRNNFGISDNIDKSIEEMEVIIDGKRYFVGELANKELALPEYLEKDRISERTLYLMAIACQLTAASDYPVQLITGLPLDQYKYEKAKFKDFLDGKSVTVEWVTGTNKGRKITTFIEESLICPQGAAAIIASLYNDLGEAVYPDYMFEGSLIALIDVGFKTTDVVTVEVGKGGKGIVPINAMCDTIDEKGMSVINAEIMKLFKADYQQDMTSHMLNQVLKGNKFAVKGEIVDYSEQLKEAEKNLAEVIIGEVKRRWREKANSLSCIFIAGGGALTLQNYFKDEFETNVHIIENSQHANAIGYLRSGKPYFEKINALNNSKSKIIEG